MHSELGKLFVGGISWDTNEERLKDHFSAYGEVVEAVIMKDRTTGRARGFGFVVFADPPVADRVIKEKHNIDGRMVEAKKAVPRDDHNVLSRKSGSIHGSPIQGRTRKIFVGGLASTVTESDFRKYFEQFGAITDLVVMYDPNTQRPRGFGFITYDSEEAVDRVLVKTFHELNGKMVEVKRAVPRELSPGPTRSPLCGYNYGLNRVNSFLNCYSQGYTPSGIGGFGVRMDGRFSPIANTRSGFPTFGSGYGMGLNFEPGLSPSYMGSGSFSDNTNYGWGPNPYYVNNSNRFGSPIGCDGGSGGSSLFTSATQDSLRNGSLSYGTNSANSNAYVGSGNGSTGGNTFGGIGVNLGASPMSAQAARNTSAHSENLRYGISDNNAYAVQLGGYGRNAVSSGYGRPFGDFYGNSSAYGETTWRSINGERDGPVSFGFGVENAASEISAKGTLGYVGDYTVSQRQSTGGIAV